MDVDEEVTISVPRLVVYDRESDKFVRLNNKIALSAKKNMELWPGVIEAGRAVAEAVLENRVCGFNKYNFFFFTHYSTGPLQEVYLL